VQIYRQFCGVCHAFAPARSAGFGSNSSTGLGTDGGPSLNQLRVPYSYTIAAITEPTGGHERVQRKITSKQLVTVARYLATATRNNPLPALPTDG
jgi:mono/diheme cytochrome c family protein